MADAIVTRKTSYHDLPEWLTPEEFARYMGIGRNTAYELIRTQAVHSRKFGRLLRGCGAAMRPTTPLGALLHRPPFAPNETLPAQDDERFGPLRCC